MAASRNRRRTDAASFVVATVDEVLARHVRHGQQVVAALSGGVDSVVLVHLLAHLLPKHGARLSAFHVHHGLNPRADDWTRYCADLCRHWDIPFASRAVTVPERSGEGLEAAARRVRHRAFLDLAADWVALAHHGGDQAETVLLNLLRGSGIGGAAAMPEARLHKLLRPMLGVERRDILAYAGQHELHWVEDGSNADARFTRNYLRLEIVPRLSTRFPAAEAMLAAAARRFGEAAGLLDELACIDLGGRPAGFPLPVRILAGLSEPRARNVLRYLLANAGVRIPSEQRLSEVLRQLLGAGPDRHPEVHFGDHAIVRRRGEVDVRAL